MWKQVLIVEIQLTSLLLFTTSRFLKITLRIIFYRIRRPCDCDSATEASDHRMTEPFDCIVKIVNTVISIYQNSTIFSSSQKDNLDKKNGYFCERLCCSPFTSIPMLLFLFAYSLIFFISDSCCSLKLCVWVCVRERENSDCPPNGQFSVPISPGRILLKKENL